MDALAILGVAATPPSPSLALTMLQPGDVNIGIVEKKSAMRGGELRYANAWSLSCWFELWSVLAKYPGQPYQDTAF